MTGRRHAVRRGGRGAEESFPVEPLVIAGDDMQLGVWFGRESWKSRDTDFRAVALPFSADGFREGMKVRNTRSKMI